jgi:hypothetical protein
VTLPVVARRRSGAIAFAIVSVMVVDARRAGAQTLGPGRLELAVGAQWTGGSQNGSRDATETDPTASPLHLFSTASELSSAAGVEARVGVRVTRRFDIEAAGTYARPQLRVTATRDAEGASDTTASERLQLFSVSGGIVWALTSRTDTRTIPFLTGGAGWVRELHENDIFAVAGEQAYVGGGVKQLLRTRDGRRLKALGVRADARAVIRTKALAIDDRTHATIALTASLFVRF